MSFFALPTNFWLNTHDFTIIRISQRTSPMKILELVSSGFIQDRFYRMVLEPGMRLLRKKAINFSWLWKFVDQMSTKWTSETIENCHEASAPSLQWVHRSYRVHRRLPPSTADQGSTESRRWIIGDSEQPSEFSRRKWSNMVTTLWQNSS